MLHYLIYSVFILSVALAAAGIVIASKVRKRYIHDVFSTLLYFQVFIFTFGFYGIWGQVVIKAFLSSHLSAGLLTRISDITMLLGLPFVVFAWLMLIRFSTILSGRKNGKLFVLWFLLMNFSIIVLLGYCISEITSFQPASLLRYYFLAMNFLYSIIASALIFFPVKRNSIVHDHDRRIISPFIFLIMVLQSFLLLLYSSQPYIGLIFIFVFFAGNAFLPLYINYGTLLSAFVAETEKNLSFVEFCKKFEVSPRETDIVREICNGLSNKEISEKLFIGLQTVKDHTHRIYIKTNVRSRVQLINLVKELTQIQGRKD